jgi:hypothetical protein
MNIQPMSGATVDKGMGIHAPSEFEVASANPGEAASQKIANLDLQTHPLFNDKGNLVFDIGDPSAFFLALQTLLPGPHGSHLERCPINLHRTLRRRSSWRILLE